MLILDKIKGNVAFLKAIKENRVVLDEVRNKDEVGYSCDNSVYKLTQKMEGLRVPATLHTQTPDERFRMFKKYLGYVTEACECIKIQPVDREDYLVRIAETIAFTERVSIDRGYFLEEERKLINMTVHSALIE